jgi:hypothetical protein
VAGLGFDVIGDKSGATVFVVDADFPLDRFNSAAKLFCDSLIIDLPAFHHQRAGQFVGCPFHSAASVNLSV